MNLWTLLKVVMLLLIPVIGWISLKRCRSGMKGTPVTRACLRFTRDSLTSDTGLLIKRAAMDKMFVISRPNPSSVVTINTYEMLNILSNTDLLSATHYHWIYIWTLNAAIELLAKLVFQNNYNSSINVDKRLSSIMWLIFVRMRSQHC